MFLLLVRELSGSASLQYLPGDVLGIDTTNDAAVAVCNSDGCYCYLCREKVVRDCLASAIYEVVYADARDWETAIHRHATSSVSDRNNERLSNHKQNPVSSATGKNGRSIVVPSAFPEQLARRLSVCWSLCGEELVEIGCARK